MNSFEINEKVRVVSVEDAMICDQWASIGDIGKIIDITEVDDEKLYFVQFKKYDYLVLGMLEYELEAI